MGQADVIQGEGPWIDKGRIMETIKVRITPRMAEEWKDRELSWLPHTPGVHEFTRQDCIDNIKFLKSDFEELKWEGGWIEFGPLLSAIKRQIQNFEKALQG